jgi:hypothetical protein
MNSHYLICLFLFKLIGLVRDHDQIESAPSLWNGLRVILSEPLHHVCMALEQVDKLSWVQVSYLYKGLKFCLLTPTYLLAPAWIFYSQNHLFSSVSAQIKRTCELTVKWKLDHFCGGLVKWNSCDEVLPPSESVTVYAYCLKFHHQYASSETWRYPGIFVHDQMWKSIRFEYSTQESSLRFQCSSQAWRTES